jgi:hypothetical protein
VLDDVTVTAGLIEIMPAAFAIEVAELKSIARCTGEPAVKVSGNGELETVAVDVVRVGDSEHVVVLTVVLGHEVVPSVKAPPELFNTFNRGLENVMAKLEYVPAGTSLSASSAFIAIRFAKFKVTGLETSVTFDWVPDPINVTLVICIPKDRTVKPVGA